MEEGRSRLLVGLRQGDPCLNAVHQRTVRARVFEPLAMRDAAACNHPVDLTGADFLVETKTVAMRHLPRIKVSHG